MSKLYVLIDIGCNHCGMPSNVVGSFKTKAKAVKALDAVIEVNKDYRNPGQSIPQVFEVTL